MPIPIVKAADGLHQPAVILGFIDLSDKIVIREQYVDVCIQLLAPRRALLQLDRLMPHTGKQIAAQAAFVLPEVDVPNVLIYADVGVLHHVLGIVCPRGAFQKARGIAKHVLMIVMIYMQDPIVRVRVCQS